MANEQDQKKADDILKSLSSEGDDQKRQALFEQVATQVESPALQDEIIKRYSSVGRELLSDTLPSHVDPMVARILKPMIGDVSKVRVHTGKTATDAAKAMDARAFAVGDSDVFMDESEFSPGSTQGRALLAHELAHTRDVATGFALSQRDGHSGADREVFAHAVEDRYVQAEVDEDASVQKESFSGATEVSEPQESAEVDVDKDDLEDRIWSIIQRQQRRASERFGR
jgi:hypothetical protein